MSTPVWPVTLPPNLLMSGYQETWPDVILRTTMDAGPAKVRKRFSAGVRPVTGQVIVTADQLEALKSFYEKDCASGAIAFSWTDPAGGRPRCFRFVKQPVNVPQSVGGIALYQVTLDLEVMP